MSRFSIGTWRVNLITWCCVVLLSCFVRELAGFVGGRGGVGGKGFLRVDPLGSRRVRVRSLVWGNVGPLAVTCCCLSNVR